MEFNIAFHFIRLSIGGVVCFLSILLMSKTRDAEWMFIVSAFLFMYFFEVLSLLIQLGLFPLNSFGIVSFLQYIVPSILFIVAFIIKLLKKRG